MSQLYQQSLDASQASQLIELTPVLFESQDESQNNVLSPPRGWISEHFTVEVAANGRFRTCRAEGCSKRYAFGTSTRIYKDHWARDHSAMVDLKKTRFMFSDQLHTSRIVKCVIDCRWDFATVDKPSFRSMLAAFNPNKTVLCRQTLSNLINRGRGALTQKITDKLANAESISLTFDIWSARKGSRGFGCLTAHYISSFGKMDGLILKFERMKYPHDADTILNFITKGIKTFKLEKRVLSITTDNASNNIAALRDIDRSMVLILPGLEFVHYKCVAHIMNLAVQDALKEMKDTISPVREAVNAIRSSGKRKESFVRKQTELIDEVDLNIEKPYELIEDVDHRWNSTFLMLERALLLRQAIDWLIDTTRGMELIGPINWGKIQVICQFLKPFYDATKRYSHETDVTISKVARINPRLVDHCAKFEENSLETVCAAAKVLRDKLTSYELEIYKPIVALAHFLDPRYKTKDMSEPEIEIVVANVRNIMSQVPTPSIETASQSRDSLLGDDSDDETPSDEISEYRQERREKFATDVIFWWKNNSTRFPKLASVARRVLAIQATSVASERIFSLSGGVDTKTRNRLSDESVENIVAFRSWFKFLNIE